MSLRRGDNLIAGRSQAYNPTVSVEKVEGGNKVSFTDINHTESIIVKDGLMGASSSLDPNPCEVVFNADGSILETYPHGTKLTEFNSDGSIIETFTKDGVVTKQKTTFNADGSISIQLV